MDQIKRKKNPFKIVPYQHSTNNVSRSQAMTLLISWSNVRSAGSNVRRIVRAKRNMKIANSSQIKIFFHRFFYSYSFIYLFLAKE